MTTLTLKKPDDAIVEPDTTKTEKEINEERHALKLANEQLYKELWADVNERNKHRPPHGRMEYVYYDRKTPQIPPEVGLESFDRQLDRLRKLKEIADIQRDLGVQ